MEDHHGDETLNGVEPVATAGSKSILKVNDDMVDVCTKIFNLINSFTNYSEVNNNSTLYQHGYIHYTINNNPK